VLTRSLWLVYNEVSARAAKTKRDMLLPASPRAVAVAANEERDVCMRAAKVGLAICASIIAALPSAAHAVGREVSAASASTNWAGYAVLPPSGTTVTSVQGTWVIPSISAKPDGYSSIWVGIDGYDSATVEQIGIEADSSASLDWSGPSQYYAWYELYPKNLVAIDMILHPGDTMHAEVAYQGSDRFSLSIQDITTGASFSTTRTASGALRSSGEWIAEAPSGNGVLPLANFGTATFMEASATLSDGQSGPISNFQFDQIDMLPTSSGLGASTSPLDVTGSQFEVTAVPEPSTLILFGTGAISLLAYAWRRQ
jgi:hypothetical protein